MLNLSLLDVTLLIGMCALFLLGMAVALVLLRRVIAQVEDATATLEILQEHPDLLRGARWELWTGSVSLPAGRPPAHPRPIGHA
jgi:hypothetical protein